MWDEITYPFPNFNGCTVEVWEYISNFIVNFILDSTIAITVPADILAYSSSRTSFIVLRKEFLPVRLFRRDSKHTTLLQYMYKLECIPVYFLTWNVFR